MTVPPDAGLDTPVAFIVFNRPEPTRRVFAAIRAARPATLLIIGDGARLGRAGEAERVAEVRAIVAGVDWPCRVLTNLSDVNLGCGKRVSSGLDWVFGQVDRAIILEDDCLPAPAFFRYSTEMLDRYRDDRRVYSISGSNFSGASAGDGHYLSNYALMWGWATWADRWADYRFSPADAPRILRRKWRGSPLRFLYWSKIYAALARGRIDTWDYQWILTLWRQHALAVRPCVNLVQNIGFGTDATHTTLASTPLSEMKAIDVSGSFAATTGPVAPNCERDRSDEMHWMQLNWRSVLLMHYPWLSRRKWTRL